MSEIARWVQNHPYQTLAAFGLLLAWLIIREVWHAQMHRQLLRQVRSGQPVPSATPAKSQNMGCAPFFWTVLVVAGLGYIAPSVLPGLKGTESGTPLLTEALTSGTYRGTATGPLGFAADVTMHLDMAQKTARIVLGGGMGEYTVPLTVTPQSGGAYLQGDLVGGQTTFGDFKGHVTPTRFEGNATNVGIPWTLDLRR